MDCKDEYVDKPNIMSSLRRARPYGTSAAQESVQMNRQDSGYSLAELLVVVAIIGITSLVLVPNFISMQRAGKLKASLREFTSDMRRMRQRAVTKRQQTKLSFTTGSAATARDYTINEWDPTTSAWKQIGPPKRLEESCYLSSQTNFPDRNSDGTQDITFKSDGTPLFDAGVFRGTAVMDTDWKIPTPRYTITVELSGAVKAN